MNLTIAVLPRSLLRRFAFPPGRYITASTLALTFASMAVAGTAIKTDSAGYVSTANVEQQVTTAKFAVARVSAAPKTEIASQASVQSPAQSKATQVKTTKIRRGPSKIITPIIEGFAELRNPVALVIAAKNRLLSATHFRMSDAALEPEPMGGAAIAPIDVTFAMLPPYELTTPTSTAVSRLTNAIDQELHPGIAPDRPLPLVRSSATQLNMRVSDAVNFVWEVDHNESPVDGSEVGMGVGFKVAF